MMQILKFNAALSLACILKKVLYPACVNTIQGAAIFLEEVNLHKKIKMPFFRPSQRNGKYWFNGTLCAFLGRKLNKYIFSKCQILKKGFTKTYRSKVIYFLSICQLV